MDKIIHTKEIVSEKAIKEVLVGAKVTNLDFGYSSFDVDDYPENILIEVIRDGNKHYIEFGADCSDVTVKTVEEVEENPFYMKLEGPDRKGLKDLPICEREKLMVKYIKRGVQFRRKAELWKNTESFLGTTPMADAYMFYSKASHMIAYTILQTIKEEEKNLEKRDVLSAGSE